MVQSVYSSDRDRVRLGARTNNDFRKMKTTTKLAQCIQRASIGALLLGAAISAHAGVSNLTVGWYTDFKGTVVAQGSSSTAYITAISADWQNIPNSAPLPPNHSDPFITFCLDFNANLASGWWKSGGFADNSLNTQSTPATRQADSLFRAANLYATYAPGVIGAFSSTSSTARNLARVEGAALQLAIWEVLYEPNPGNVNSAYNVLTESSANSGFRSSGVNPMVTTRANQMLTTASTANFNLETTFWNAVTDATGTTSRSSQDLIGPFAPVPEPATYFAAAMLCIPLIVNGYRSVKKNK